MILKHRCGAEATLACFDDNVAIFLYCDSCRDIIEIGELSIINVKGEDQHAWINDPKRKFRVALIDQPLVGVVNVSEEKK